jgi:hypothetical protein
MVLEYQSSYETQAALAELPALGLQTLVLDVLSLAINASNPALKAREFEPGLEERFDNPSPSSWRFSHLWTVRTEMPNAAAITSILSPPARRSTICSQL